MKDKVGELLAGMYYFGTCHYLNSSCSRKMDVVQNTDNSFTLFKAATPSVYYLCLAELQEKRFYRAIPTEQPCPVTAETEFGCFSLIMQPLARLVARSSLLAAPFAVLAIK